ncbi:hypothetical protein [Sphingobacterium chuzhouense]|uniref:hypothetical protein n=1 Tax=Sphingobacterium chuzhouense TaxID=1742264 RepID=UPI0036D2F1B9
MSYSKTIYRGSKIITYQILETRITKLTGKEMKWENASPGDGNTNKRLVKY